MQNRSSIKLPASEPVPPSVPQGSGLFSHSHPAPIAQSSDCPHCAFDRSLEDEVAHWKRCSKYRTFARSIINGYLFTKADFEKRINNSSDPALADSLTFLISLWQKGEMVGEFDAALCLDSTSDESIAANVHMPTYNIVQQVLSDAPSPFAAKLAIEDAARDIMAAKGQPSRLPYDQIPGSEPHRREAWSEEEVAWLTNRVNAFPITPENIAQNFKSEFEQRMGGTRDPMSVLLKIEMLNGQRKVLRPVGLSALEELCLRQYAGRQVEDADALRMYRDMAIRQG